ncbi:sugar ABC transporter substrate-binding protein [Paractinoplanes lichenicola]|uniref:Extracellular solute-binding protein n=1 Tax=Paractinoplanes lichenicola TaxID=2802976 RepID=A0ABS1VIQ2_9ACTN|nr:extracellular solute-binding protein [Actinoplanes lichenicola]MBL7253617.1 extracellular solute-binding protein [Actinoplanes lichenicola]
MRSKLCGAALAAVLVVTSACGSGFDDNGSTTTQESTGPADLKIMIASSGDAETKAVTAAATAWASSSGNKATITPAQDIVQQLGQALAGSTPPDVFYVDAARFADYASVGALEPYAQGLDGVDAFLPNLRQSFTYEDKLYCVPKDTSTLALQINTDLWAKAGLTDADIPTTWEQLRSTAEKIKAKGVTPLAIGDTRDRIGAFLVQAGGYWVSADGKQATGDTPQNVEALTYVQGLLKDGLAKYPKAMDAGWAGEAFGKGKAAMAIEGNWIKGALKADFPAIKYTVKELPAGPKGKGTLSFTQCWGIAAKSKFKSQAVAFVQAMTGADQQLSFSKAFGVMPSRQDAQATYQQQNPDDAAFVAGAQYAQGPVNAPKMDSVLADLDAGLQGLQNGNPATVLQRFDKNAKTALGG